MSYRITIGDHVCLADAPITWARTAGVTPSIVTVRLPAAVADQIMISEAGAAHPYDLTCQNMDNAVGGSLAAPTQENEAPWKVSGLYAIAQAPTEAPQIGCVVFADRRHWWAYHGVTAFYNMRRRTGVQYLVPAGTEPTFTTLQLSDKLGFRRFSLKLQQTVWNVKDMLLDVIGRVDPGAEVVFDLDTVEDVRVDDVTIDTGEGHTAVEQVLQYLPSVAITVDNNSRIVVYNRAAGRGVDEGTASKLGPPIEGSMHLYTQDLRCIAPTEYRVRFQCDVEVRFDAEEGGDYATDPDETERVLRNVIAVPDFSLEYGGETLPNGTYLEIEEYLGAIPAPPGLGGGVKIDLPFLRTACVPGVGLYEALGRFGEFDYDADWQARISGMANDFRQLYRLPRAWVDSYLRMVAARVATINPATGTRGRSVVFADHALIAANKSMVRDYRALGSAGIAYAQNVRGWTERISSSSHPSPVILSIDDEDQGVLRMNFTTDPWGRSVVCLPGIVTAEGLPAISSVQGRQQPLFYNALTQSEDLPELDEEYKAAMIVTLTLPWTYDVTVTPADVADKLTPDAKEIAENARGIPMVVRVRDEQARFGWDDDKAGEVEIFALTGARMPTLEPTNAGTTGQSGASLRSIAESIAIRGWSSYAKHLAGQMTGGHGSFGSPPLRGFAERIETSIRNDGTILTDAFFAERLPTFDWTTILDPQTRAFLLRQVPPA